VIAVEEALARIEAALAPLPLEWVHVDHARGRVLGVDLAARRDQPAADVSAMDGYAVRAAEAVAGAVLAVEGEAAAGSPAGGPLAAGTARRIFTGGLVPAGADTVLIQENAERRGGEIVVRVAAEPGRHIRGRAQGFAAGTVGLGAGRRLTARDLGLAVALGHGHLAVHRRPRVGVAGTGSELVRPGVAAGPAEVPNSNVTALLAALESFGATPLDLGIVADRADALAELADRARGLDLLVTTGGASVGEHDLVRGALGEVGLALDFWKIAMRPGKPLLFGRLGDVPVLGLPGNPVSALVCALLFVRPAVDRLAGAPAVDLPGLEAELAAPLGPGGERRDFLRATLEPGPTADGRPRVRAADRQDSAMLATLARADGLIDRPAHVAAQPAGSLVRVVRFTDFPGF
jgi:molybdopterin molybdotransferase